MEHLMSPRERRERQREVRNVPPVPWLGFDHDENEHPLTTIQEYPFRRGWTRENVQGLQNGNLGNRSQTEALAMIQGWMFFGLLESAFNSRFKAKHFVVTAVDGRRVMDTSYLRKWINDYHSSNNLRPTSNVHQRRAQQNRLVDSLKYAAIWNQRLVDVEKEMGGRSRLVNSEFFGPVTRLITLIAEAVWTVAQQFPSLDERLFIQCDWSISKINERDLQARLTGRGWCQSLYSKIKNMARTPSSFLEYVSFVPPLENLVGKHGNCSADECVAYNVDVPNYHTTHRIEGCKCEMIHPPVRDVKEALLEWTVPIMNGIGLLDLNSEGTVQVYSSKKPLKFVAFSHVWSDGLGSVTEDGLRKCQVEYLLDVALQAAGTTMFWIDSLCVPKEHDIRKRAISMMAKTYESADTTVVLDSRIQRCSLSVSLEAKIVSLSLSKWQDRLWTLQSSLSKRVVFAFEDGLAPAGTITSESSTKIHRPVVRTGHILLDNLSDWVHNSEVTVGGLQRNLYRRTSSRPDDESLAVAPFLKIDIAPLLEVQGEERMKRFWSGVRHVPKGIVFHSLPMIDQDGYGWAPRSIMNQKDAPMLDLKDQSATVTEDGLKGKYWVYELQTPSQVQLQGETLFYDPQSTCCLRVIEHISAPNISLSSSCIVIFTDQLVPSMDTHLGVALSGVSDLRGTSDRHTPMYKYRGIVGANLFSKAEAAAISGSDMFWNILVNSARGGVTGKWAEILIR